MKVLKTVKKAAVKTAALWKKDGQYIFCGLTTLLCIGIVWLVRPLDNFLVSAGMIISSLMFIRLRFATVEIESGWIRYGWSALNFGLYALILHFIPCQIIGFTAALIVNIILYSWISYLSYLMGLTDTEKSYDISTDRMTKLNGTFLSLFINCACLFAYAIREENRRDDELFKRAEYVRVINWDREIIRGNTYYIVKLPDKTIAINPREYPQIRDINDKTQIKVLTGVTTYNSFPEIKRLKIKNY